MFHRSWRLALVALLPLASLLTGCAPTGHGFAQESDLQHSEQLLAQRKRDLSRAIRDLSELQTTRRHLAEHYAADELIDFDHFLTSYLEEQVAPLLNNQWQSAHAELAPLDANLRILQADSLVELSRPFSAKRVMREITQRYADRSDMLVTYPAGRRETVHEALAQLEAKNGRG